MKNAILLALVGDSGLPVGDLEAEYFHSLRKYSDWSEKTFEEMIDCLKAELGELDTAIALEDAAGEHGIFNEAIQVANCAMKIAKQARERARAAGIRC